VEVPYRRADARYLERDVLHPGSAVVHDEPVHLRTQEVRPHGLVQSEGHAALRAAHHLGSHARTRLARHALTLAARVEVVGPVALEAHDLFEPLDHRPHRQEVTSEVVETEVRPRDDRLIEGGLPKPENHVADGRRDVEPCSLVGMFDVGDESGAATRELVGIGPDVVDGEHDLPDPIGMMVEEPGPDLIPVLGFDAVHMTWPRRERVALNPKPHPVEELLIALLLPHEELDEIDPLDALHFNTPFPAVRRSAY